MRGLHLLIEMARRTVDEQRGALGRIGLAKADIEAALAAHDAGLEKESRVAANDPAVMAALTGWSSHVARRRVMLHARTAELDKTESDARDCLRSAFVYLKRLEMARDSASRQERIVAIKRDQNLAEEQYSSTVTFAHP